MISYSNRQPTIFGLVAVIVVFYGSIAGLAAYFYLS